ncbi:MAG: hypothetical protein AVDCRST_MAG10-3759 [uncultured Acidimicrobiales bacterium]|uniref:Uncharacterized protein n=1 Tax=uncultured Acidimicrobiales bacterium TaxID=310071 RepID=A0A6J4JGY0_9ACTN|nr:MAG: hypothetical protein AVDCRST_MAG10-3759 [uncultured Acidimicrobiales bacterium]
MLIGARLAQAIRPVTSCKRQLLERFRASVRVAGHHRDQGVG